MQAITFSSNLSQRTVKLRRRSARRPIQRGEKLTLGGRICLEVERIRRQMSPQGTHYPSKTQMPPEGAING